MTQRSPDERSVLEAIEKDDAYQVIRVISDGASGRAELVMRGSDGPFMRKKYPLGFANTDVVARIKQLDEPCSRGSSRTMSCPIVMSSCATG